VSYPRSTLKQEYDSRTLLINNLNYPSGTGKEEASIASEAMYERDVMDDAILRERSLDVMRRAESAGIPVPPFSDNTKWEDGFEPNTAHLSAQAQLDMNKAIRAEQRDKWSFFAFLVKEVAVPVIGGIGAIMGLLSLIHSFLHK